MAKAQIHRGTTSDTEPSKKLSLQSLRELSGLFEFLLPYKWKFGLGLLFLAGSSLTSLAFPYVIGDLVDSALKGTTVVDSLFTGINGRARLLLVILIVQAAFSFVRVLLFVEVGEKAMADLRSKLFGHLLHLPMAFYSRSRVGELNSRISADISLIQETLVTTTAEVIRAFLHIVIGIGLLVFISGKLTLVMLVSFPVVILVAMYFGRYIRRLAKQGQDRLAEAGIVIDESFQGIQNVKAFTNEGFELGRFNSSMQQVVRLAVRAAWYRGGFASFIIFALFGSIVLVIWYGSVLVQGGHLSIGELTKFLMYTLFVGGAIGSVGDRLTQLLKAIGATDRVRELLRETPEPSAGEAQPATRLEGAVRFQKVSFHYPSRPDVEVLQGVDFEVSPGEKVAIVGASGAGKSTIMSLLLRFYDPVQGTILFDGKPSQAYPIAYLRRQMALVPQEVLLFGGTIRENIAYGKLGATEDEIRQAAQRANALSFIEQFPDGFDTVVGERGIQLSGGQRQRVAIARALLRDPAILILDEATSSLDAEAEHQVQAALEELMKGRTTFIVAHRLATVRKVDSILVLENGLIREQGTHDALMALQDGIYRKVATMQFLDTPQAVEAALLS